VHNAVLGLVTRRADGRWQIGDGACHRRAARFACRVAAICSRTRRCSSVRLRSSERRSGRSQPARASRCRSSKRQDPPLGSNACPVQDSVKAPRHISCQTVSQRLHWIGSRAFEMTTVKVSGGLAFSELDFSEDLDVFRNTLEQGCVVAIDLTEVDLVDRDAVTLLARTEGNGIELRHCPAYREWVTRERGRR
jgi:hypothetical protein